MFLGFNSNQFITCILSLILLIIILLSKDLIGDRTQLFFLVIVVLLIIVVCLIENLQFLGINQESFSNLKLPLKNKNCFHRSKQFDSYENKIDNRLDSWREIEEKDREMVNYDDENVKLQEMLQFKSDYLSNGESF